MTQRHNKTHRRLNLEPKQTALITHRTILNSMKKIFITLFIFLFTATAISYAGIYSTPSSSSESSGSGGGGFYSNQSNNSGGDSGAGALFRSSTNDPGGRPGGGDGIGQEAPLGNGLRTLIICAFIYGVVKISSRKGRKC